MKRTPLVLLVWSALLTIPADFVSEPGAAAQMQSAARVVYAAPNGSPSNDGSVGRPLDLAGALRKGRIAPGTTLLLRGGVYEGPFRSELSGTRDARITMRSVPGENAVLTVKTGRGDGGTINVFGEWTDYRDFEVTNSNRDRAYGSGFRLMGFNIQAPHTRFINLVVHDAGHGFGFWKEAVDSELYGNIIFNGGSENSAADMRHGHAIYMQNTEGEKQILDNVMFDEFGWGMHGYPGPGGVTGFHIEGNVSFNNGLASNPRQHYNNLMVSGHTPFRTDNLQFVENFTYYPQGQNRVGKFTDANMCLGCSDREVNGSATVRGNYLVNGSPVILADGWQQLSIENNTVVGPAALVALNRPAKSSGLKYILQGNHYYSTSNGPSAPFLLDGKEMELKAWQQNGWDSGSGVATQHPSGQNIFVRPNRYEKGRAHVVIYNWDHAPEARVDLSRVLSSGAQFEIFNVQSLNGPPVLRGTYDGSPVRLPMGPEPVTLPLGAEGKLAGARAELATGPEFNVFLVKAVVAGQALPAASTEQVRAPAVATPNTEAKDQSSTPSAYQPFIGNYVSADARARAEVSFNGHGLSIEILSEPGKPQYELEQSNGPRFRLKGTPAGFFVDFSVDGNQVRGINLIRGTLPSVYLRKQ